MTVEQFNALPLEARRYIEQQQKTCLSCGKKPNLETHYKNYLKMKKNQLFTLRTGAVNFFSKKEDKAKMLYPLSERDTEEAKKEKLKMAVQLHEARPDLFLVFNESEIKEALNEKAPAKKEAKKEATKAPAKTEQKVVNLEANKKATEENDSVDHVLTEQDFIDYPELTEKGFKLGETVKRKKE